ncbi:MAG: cytosol nonspecific dipeptidase, partial [Methanobacterium sp.]
AKDVYKDHYPEEYQATFIHAGLECGWVVDKYKNENPSMDCISIGPTVKDPHTPKERLDTGSVQNFWDCLVAILNAV